jgi:hypothetical protein
MPVLSTLGGASASGFALNRLAAAIGATDEFFANTVLLLQADDFADGSQNNTFLDSSTNTHTITRNGNVTQGSFSPFSQDEGKWGVYFDGTGDRLNTPSSSDFTFGTGDFTVECWAQWDGTNDRGVWQTTSTGDVTTSYELGIAFEGGGISSIIKNSQASNESVSANTWYHIAMCRNSGTTKVFLNGTEIRSVSDTTNYTYNSLVIGGYYSTDYLMNGYVSNFRVVKGTAVYTSAFTPPTDPLTAITNTSILTCQSNRFVDNSSNAHAITVNGDPEVTPFSPFAPSTAYDPATKGGSGYFDGSSTTGLNVATGQISVSGAYTLEGWFYINSFANQNQIFATSGYSGGTGGHYVRIQTTGELEAFYNDSSGLEMGASTLSLNEWHHFALVRNASNTMSLFVDGTRYDTVTISGTLNIVRSGDTANIGYSQAFSGRNVNGYISNFRIVSGTAIYDPTQTTIAVPTAPLTAIINTSLLCNFTNAGIYDGTGRNVLETVGDAQVDTAVKKYGTGSMQFDGTGDYLDFASNQNLAFGTGNFTVEFWINKGAGDTEVLMDFRTSTNASDGLVLVIYNGLKLTYFTNSADQAQDPTALVQDTWIHYAIARDSGTTRLFRDGTLVATKTSDTFNFTNPNLRVGERLASTGLPFNGYIDDLRITKGVARYTANFTPPAAVLPKQ